MDETVNTAKVNEYAITCDVLDSSLKNLTFLKLADDLALLLLKFSLDKSFVGYDNVAELLIDLDNLEIHCRVNILIVVADRFDIDLRTREECLDSEYIDDHTAFCTGLDITLYNLVCCKCCIYHIPRTELTCLLV